MIAAFVTFIMVIGIIGFSGDGNTLAIVGCVAVIAIAWVFHIAAVEDTKAWANRTHYWSMSGKDRAKARHRWEAEARREEEREKQKRAERIQRKRKTATKNESVATRVQAKDRTICPECGRRMEVEWSRRYPSGTVFTSYVCGTCGYKRLNNEGADADVKVPCNTASTQRRNQNHGIAARGQTDREAQYRSERTVMDDIFQTHNRGGKGA